VDGREQFNKITCAACGSPYHEATGHIHSENTVLCGACAKDFSKWLRGMMSRRWGGVRFYDHIETSANKK
jgi:hypothetical protein